MDSIERLWDRIETWLQVNASAIAQALAGGVTEEDLRQAEETMGLSLPEDVKASYRRQNGFYSGSLLMGQSIFYDLAGMVQGQQGLKDFWADLLSRETRSPNYLSGPIQPVWWHPAWLPLTGDGAGNLWCVDLSPTSGGQRGQIIAFDHEVGPTQVIATSLQALLSRFADQVEAGHYVADGLHLVEPENIWAPEDRTRSNPDRVREVTVPALPTISTHASIPSNALAEAINRLYREVRAYLDQHGIQPLMEQSLTVYARYEEAQKSQLALEVGIAVVEAGTEHEPGRVGTLPGGTVAALPQICHRDVAGTISAENRVFLGPADLRTIAAEGFDALEQWRKQQQKTFVGQPWLIFWIDPQDPQDVPAPDSTVFFEAQRLLTN